MSGRPGTSSGRPGTSSGRPGTSSGLNPVVRPGTGQRGMLSSSAGRPLTGRLGTGQAVPATPGQMAGYGVSLNTEVNVSDRPVTQQGMMGMRVGTAGPGRQVQDASYFMGKLHSKISEITTEVEKIRREIDQDAKDKSQYTQLERKYEVLAIEVRDLEGQLADYNLAMDKLRSATDPSEIRQVQDQLSNRNQKEAEEVDRIFILRQEQEKAVRRMEDEMNEIHLKHQDKINQLAPNKLTKYKELLEENHQSEMEIEARSQELEMLMHAIHQKENEMNQDRYREEYDQLEKQARRLQKERDNLQEEAKTALMDPNEARNVLLNKVKEDKNKIESLERVLNNIHDENQDLKKILQEIKNDLEERRSGGTNGQGGAEEKYEMLFQRDKEMTAFLDTFNTKRDEELKNQRNTQMMVVKLLEHISTGLTKEDKITPTTTANLEEMKNDLTFKERQLESSVSTKQRLTQELTKRQAELDKVNTLDTKISLELNSLLEKMNTMENDMQEFTKIDFLKETHQQTKQFLQRMKQQYIRRRDAMKQQVNLLNTNYENLKNEVNTNDTAKNMEALEQKLRHHEQNIFHLKEFIDTKGREINYDVLKQDCLKTLQELNTLRIKMQSMELGTPIRY